MLGIRNVWCGERGRVMWGATRNIFIPGIRKVWTNIYGSDYGARLPLKGLIRLFSNMELKSIGERGLELASSSMGGMSPGIDDDSESSEMKCMSVHTSKIHKPGEEQVNFDNIPLLSCICEMDYVLRKFGEKVKFDQETISDKYILFYCFFVPPREHLQKLKQEISFDFLRSYKRISKMLWPVNPEEQKTPFPSIRSCPITSNLNHAELEYEDHINMMVSVSKTPFPIEIGQSFDFLSLLSGKDDMNYRCRNGGCRSVRVDISFPLSRRSTNNPGIKG
ncbi:hypothetical protein DM860_006611 [Cuscuta australis]|uniref:Uncharacterized protein n=1 Tax=Cuscuta australis TaxID=267555 RepID=A0A328D892_9ASTE|nr:hypothetical protein DM860_006611 [Cuscuta australis]